MLAENKKAMEKAMAETDFRVAVIHCDFCDGALLETDDKSIGEHLASEFHRRGGYNYGGKVTMLKKAGGKRRKKPKKLLRHLKMNVYYKTTPTKGTKEWYCIIGLHAIHVIHATT